MANNFLPKSPKPTYGLMYQDLAVFHSNPTWQWEPMDQEGWGMTCIGGGDPPWEGWEGIKVHFPPLPKQVRVSQWLCGGQN